ATIRAKNVDDETIEVYDKTVPLGAVGDSGALPVMPSDCVIVAGVWNGDITIDAVDANAVLTVDDGAGHVANSNAFDVSYGPLDHFQWSTINSPQYQNTPFEVTVTAVDAHGYRVIDFDDTVELGGWMSAVEQVTVGTGTSYWIHPMCTNYHDSRTQVIYLQNEIGSACEITSLALDVTAFPAQAINEWTIRMKHTPLNSYSTATLESTGWTIVYHNDETVISTGWINFVFSTPFDYNGTDNLMIDFSHNNSYSTNAGTCRYTPSASRRVAFARSNSAYGDPLDWSGTSSPNVYSEKLVPNLRLTTSTWDMVSITPQITDTFVDGVWTGDVTVFEEIAEMYLRADDSSGHAADSNTFEVMADTIAPMVTDVLVKGNAWNDDFLGTLDAEDLGHPHLTRLGYRLLSGEGQLDALPWGNLDQITIVFSENVAVAENDMGLYSGNMQIHDVAGFGYEVATHAATWTFHEPLGRNLFLIALTDAVRDVAGNALDGEWENSTSAFPSGNGAPGGSFSFLFNVLPGDFNFSGMVDSEDLGIWENGIGTMGGAYLDDGDADGDGDVDGNDFLIWQQNFGSSASLGSVFPSFTGLSANDKRTACLDNPFHSRNVNQLFQRDRAIDTVMSSFVEQFTLPLLKGLHGKIFEDIL
ncbi:MAG: hypothetical protein JW829_07685, partial [Pirellulales bacterium]|nr:hypothetical protein [Pirellulales bacterium]